MVNIYKRLSLTFYFTLLPYGVKGCDLSGFGLHKEKSKGGVIKFLLVILKYSLFYIDVNVFNPQGFV